jgi:hypothetical protein
MKFDPNNPLSDDELKVLGDNDFDAFLEYLDGMEAHKKRKGNPKIKEHKEKKRQALRDTGITKIKTNRDQWFD